MTDIITFTPDELTPDRETVFRSQGIPAERPVTEQVELLWTRALDLLSKAAAPVGIISEIPKSDFEVVYRGEGQNERSTPVADIFPRADKLALFAVTLGQRIGQEINQCFQSNDFALAYMLDALASAAADGAAKMAQLRFLHILSAAMEPNHTTKVLRYSPGYCGWHVSGQRKLFEFLGPEQVGISLRESFLMEPLKSVSGVMIAGPAEIHSFVNTYPFCSRCETQGCRERIRALAAE